MYSFSKKIIQVPVVLLTLIATPKSLAANNLFFSSNTILAQSVNSDITYPLPKSLPSGTKIRLFSSSSMVVINQALKQRYEEKYPDTEVELVTGDTSGVLKALLEGETDLVAVGRQLTTEEKGQGLVEVPINRGKIAIIVASENPFKENLSFEKFAKILRGEITNWSTLGGPKVPIRFIDRPESSDTREALKSYDVFKKSPFRTGSNATQVSEDDTAAVVKELGKDGISYAIADQVLNRENVRVISMHKTLPTNPLYPYSQPRNYVYKKDTASREVLAFLGLVTSQGGQQVVAAIDKQGGSDLATLTPVNKAKPSETVTSPSPNTQKDTKLNKQEKTDSAKFEGIVSGPSPNTEGETGGVGTPPTGDTNKETEKKGFPWPVLLLLGIPLLGALLWQLFRKVGNESIGTGQTKVAPGTTTDSGYPPVGGTPVAGAEISETTEVSETTSKDGNEANVGTPSTGIPPIVGAAGVAGVGGLLAAWAGVEKNSQISLSPGVNQTALASWSVPEAEQQAATLHGAQQFQLRVYDVTANEPDSEPTQSIQEYDVDESTTELVIENIEAPRDIQAEIGYVTDDDRWLLLARSNRIRMLKDYISTDIEVAKEPDLEKVERVKSALPPCKITITSDNTENMMVAWEVPQVTQNALKEQGGEQYQLRIYDVTDIDLDKTPAYNVQAYDCKESTQEMQIPIFMIDREYQAEIGYVSNDGKWLKLSRSERIYVSTLDINDVKTTQSDATQTTVVTPDEVLKSSWITIVPCDHQTAYVHWEVSQTAKDVAKQKGGQQYQLRIFDVTDIDVDSQEVQNIQQYDCDESSHKQQIPINVNSLGYVDYLAEIGYVTDSFEWLSIARSNPLRIPILT